VLTGPTALEGFDVTLYATSGGGGPPDTLATATSAADGTFDLSYDVPANPGAVLHLLASNTTPPPDPGAVTLASVLGRAPIPSDVVVNERTTVASAYAMTQFTENNVIAGRAPGLQNAAGMVRNLVDLSSGDISPVLAGSPNGSDTSTRDTFNSLANMIAACVASPGTQCPALFEASTPPGNRCRPTPSSDGRHQPLPVAERHHPDGVVVVASRAVPAGAVVGARRPASGCRSSAASTRRSAPPGSPPDRRSPRR
jgi:hypothetical protein